MFEFLTFPARMRDFLTFGLNFSLFSLFAGERQPVNDMVLTMSLGGLAW
jgi:hypothetical protein